MPAVRPKCKRGHSPYISAEGTVFPCCWIATEPHLLKEMLGDLYQQLNINVHEFDDVLNSEALAKLESTWELGTFEQCVVYCGDEAPTESPTSVDNEMTIRL